MADDNWAAAADAQEAMSKKNGEPSPESHAPTSAPSASGDAFDDDDEKVSKAEQSLMNKLIRKELAMASSKADLEVLQKDPNSPLYSVKSFNSLNLKEQLLKGVFDMGFNAPSKIQETALPALLGNPPKNMIAQSQSGTGKTAAFVLTMLSRVDSSLRHPQCICLAPTFELALQIGEVTSKMAKYMDDVSVKYAVRGERVNRGEQLTEQIVIGTPGTMMDWVIKHKFFDPKKVNVFVLDEADVMIDTQGHKDQSIRIQRTLRPNCQMLLFSATYEKEVMNFAQHVIENPIVIRLRREEESLDNIRQFYIECRSKEEKLRAVSNIYGTITSKKTANWVMEQMTGQGHAVALLSSDLTVEQRAAVINRFKDGKEKVLITTNVSARGIDVEQVTLVVNFDLPTLHPSGAADCDTYLHRIGRTGRFGKQGIAINMLDSQRARQVMDVIQKHFGREINRLDSEDREAIEQIDQ